MVFFPFLSLKEPELFKGVLSWFLLVKLTSITTLCCYGYIRIQSKTYFWRFSNIFPCFSNILFLSMGVVFFLSTGVVLVFFIYTVTKVDYAKVQMVWHYLQQTLICLQRSGSSRNTLVLVLFY